jgi:integrase
MPAAAKKVNFTDRFLGSLKPAQPGTRPLLWDSQVAGFGVRITERGRISFVVNKRPAHSLKTVMVTIGNYPDMSLKEARAAAEAALKTLRTGTTPKAEREAAERARRRAEEGSFAHVAERYIRERVAKLRTAGPMEQLIRRELIPLLGERPVNEIKRPEIRALVERIRDDYQVLPGKRRAIRGGEAAATKALSCLSGLFSWADDLVEVNPCIGVRKKLGKPAKRRRTLEPHELRWLWQAAEAEGEPNGPLLKILLLSGQRLREVGNMRWSEIDLEQALLTIPYARMKGRDDIDDDRKNPHEVPLTPKVVTLLEALKAAQRVHGLTSDFVFTKDGAKPVNGFDRLKQRLDRKLAELADGREIKPWVLHDLRRTVRTGLGRLGAQGVLPHVAERVLAHAQPVLDQIYDQHPYLDEKRAALELWEAQLLAIVEPPPNVVPLRA